MTGQYKTKCQLLKEIQIATFEAVETNLYLDTHPYDSEALSALNKYENARNSAIAEYENYYGPILAYGSQFDNSKGYAWVLEPFPWEMED